MIGIVVPIVITLSTIVIIMTTGLISVITTIPIVATIIITIACSMSSKADSLRVQRFKHFFWDM